MSSSTGVIKSNYGGVRAEPPKLVFISDGTFKYPIGHPEYFTNLQPDGMLLLNLFNNEYSEFRVNSDRDFTIRLYNHCFGARYKIYIYREADNEISLSFFQEEQTFLISGLKEGETEQLIVLDIEVIKLNGILVNRIGATSEQINLVAKSLNTDYITLSQALTFNGVDQGAYTDGDTIQANETLTNILRNFVQKALPVSYTAPTFSITPNNTNIEAGAYVNPSIVPAFNKNDAGALNRYLLQLSTGGAANVSLLDQAALQTYAQAQLQVQDGAYLLYTATAYYDEGETKVNNMGVPDPTGKILAGSKSDSLLYTGIRKAFHGVGTQTVNPADSAAIRALSSSLSNPANGSTFTLNIPAGTTRVVFAYPSTLRAVSSVKYVELGNAEVADTFSLINLDVEGANGYNAISYKVYVYLPAVAFASAATYNVTI